MSVAAVIVTYNRRDKLRQCLEALINQTGGTVPDIIIVDNNSQDGTGDMVRTWSEAEGIELTYNAGDISGSRRIVYLRLLYNSGGAGGFAHGVRKAVEAGYDYVWLMDDDCVPSDDALEELMKYGRQHVGEYGFLSSRVLWMDGSLCEMNVQRETVFRDISEEKLSEESAPSEVEMASFVSLLVPSKVIYDVGLPIREFFMWTDDWEFTRRISRKYPCMIIPSSKVIHYCKANTGAYITLADDTRIDRFRYLYRNDVYLYRREGTKGFFYEAVRLAVHIGRVMASGRSLREKRRMAGIILEGTADGLRFHPAIDRAMPPEMNNNVKGE